MPRNSRPDSVWILILFMLLLAGCGRQATVSAEWSLFTRRFLADDGRIVDTGNRGISHSEGQGFGMLLAQGYGDRPGFERIWQWTRQNLQVRQDFLCAWKYVPGQGVVDRNNASDGDILIAWALLKAGREWQRDDYLKESRNILADIRHQLVREWQGKSVLLPGAAGFEKADGLTVNLSYWVFPAFRDFRQFDPSPVWDELTASGLFLLEAARFGRWHLPPDWMQLAEEVRIAPGFSPLFGYDAIRIPLYSLWGGVLSPERRRDFLAFAEECQREKGFLVPSVDLLTDVPATYEAGKGFHAVYGLLQTVADQRQEIHDRQPADSDDYYSSSLVLLARAAARMRP